MLNKRFTFLCSEEERQLIAALSQYLCRSQGNAIRFLIRVAASEMTQDPERLKQTTPELNVSSKPKDSTSGNSV